MTENKTLNKLKLFAKNLFFPDEIKCIFCDRDIQNFNDRPYCDDCAKRLKLNSGNRCKICDMPILSEENICESCQNTVTHFHRAYTPLFYENEVRQSLIAFKSDNKRYLAKAFAIILAKYIGSDIKQFDYITYVPITDKRRKARGYNQAELLANELSKLTGVPTLNTLTKTVDTVEQKNLNYKQRMSNLKKCFKLVDKSSIKDKSLLLVDDIITTTATVNSCSEVLSKYAKMVDVCAVARTILKSN